MRRKSPGDRLANWREVEALARFRRAQNVRLTWLAERYGMSAAWISLRLKGLEPITRAEVQALRGHIADLARERGVGAKPPKEPAP